MVFGFRKLKKSAGPETKKKRFGREKKSEKNVKGGIAPKGFPAERSGTLDGNVNKNVHWCRIGIWQTEPGRKKMQKNFAAKSPETKKNVARKQQKKRF